jgi:tetratricopeptide (TPR) repeat protein
MISLVEKSLVRQQTGLGDEPRFGMLETVRQYATERCEERGETQEIRRRHGRYYLAFAEAIRPHLDGPGQIEGLNRLEDEHNNLRAVVDWACDQKEIEVGLRLAIASEYLYMRGNSAEMAGWFERLLAVERSLSNPVSPSLRAEALQLGAAYALWKRGNVGQGRALTEELIVLIDELQDAREIAYRLQGAGELLSTLGELTRARAVLEQALSIFRMLDDRAGLGVVLVDLAEIAREEGNASRVIELCQESLRLSREVGNNPRVANALHNLAVAEYMQGDLGRARALCVDALELYRQNGMVSGRAELLVTLAAVVREQGDLDEAQSRLGEALGLVVSDKSEIEPTAASLEGIAGVTSDRGRPEPAVRLFGAAHALRQTSGIPVPSVNRPVHEKDLATVREALGEEQFTRGWEEGRAMTLEQAIAYALSEASRGAAAPP